MPHAWRRWTRNTTTVEKRPGLQTERERLMWKRVTDRHSGFVKLKPGGEGGEREKKSYLFHIQPGEKQADLVKKILTCHTPCKHLPVTCLRPLLWNKLSKSKNIISVVLFPIFPSPSLPHLSSWKLHTPTRLSEQKEEELHINLTSLNSQSEAFHRGTE